MQTIRIFQPFRTRQVSRPTFSVSASATKGFGTPAKKQAPPPKNAPVADVCPCDSGKAYKNCCQPIIKGEKAASSPEAALRARFTAFSKGESQFVIDNTHPDYHILQYQAATPGGAPDKLAADVGGACNKFLYMGLKIVKSEPGETEHEGFVNFEYLNRKRSAPGAPPTEEELKDVAAWSRTAQRCRFVRTTSGAWQFVDGQTMTFDANMLSGATAEPSA